MRILQMTLFNSDGTQIARVNLKNADITNNQGVFYGVDNFEFKDHKTKLSNGQMKPFKYTERDVIRFTEHVVCTEVANGKVIIHYAHGYCEIVRINS